ncbi:hypothetical protein D3C84_1297180 [compost metagenome]
MAWKSVSALPSSSTRLGMVALGLIARYAGLRWSPASRLTICASNTSSSSSSRMWMPVLHEPGVM